jgi:hypothetical protein
VSLPAVGHLDFERRRDDHAALRRRGSRDDPALSVSRTYRILPRPLFRNTSRRAYRPANPALSFRCCTPLVFRGSRTCPTEAPRPIWCLRNPTIVGRNRRGRRTSVACSRGCCFWRASAWVTSASCTGGTPSRPPARRRAQRRASLSAAPRPKPTTWSARLSIDETALAAGQFSRERP